MKRIFDLTVSLVALILLGWAILLLAVVVGRHTPGSGLFAQARVGRRRQVFTCYKLRTMYVATAEAASHETPATAVTDLGRTLRRFKLDELPQLWNVLKGDMSLVGPRPCLPMQMALIAERDRRAVYELRPGITGLAQVQGIDMSDPVRLATVDAAYARTRSLAGDIRLILRTILGAGLGDRVKP